MLILTLVFAVKIDVDTDAEIDIEAQVCSSFCVHSDSSVMAVCFNSIVQIDN